MTVAAQRAWKRQHVAEVLERTGNITGPALIPVNPVIGTDEVLGYRSKITPHHEKPRNVRALTCGWTCGWMWGFVGGLVVCIVIVHACVTTRQSPTTTDDGTHPLAPFSPLQHAHTSTPTRHNPRNTGGDPGHWFPQAWLPLAGGCWSLRDRLPEDQ
jgi:hypothetical protein